MNQMAENKTRKKNQSAAARDANLAWKSFKNGGFGKEAVPFEVLKEMVGDGNISFERKFKCLTEERKREFTRLFWASAGRRKEGENITLQMSDAVMVMRDSTAQRLAKSKMEPETIYWV